MLPLEGREGQPLRELGHAAEGRRAKAGARRLQAEEVEEEEPREGRANGQPVLRGFPRRLLGPELAPAVDLLVPRLPVRTSSMSKPNT